MAEQASGTERTRDLIEEIASGDLGGKLRSQVLAWHPGSTRDDVDEAFQDACLIAQGACRGEHEGEVYTWLRTTTHRQLGQMEKAARRRASREVLVDVSAVEFAPASTPTPDEALIEKEDDAEVSRVTREVLDKLSERQREVAVLHSHGRRRPEIAERLGMTPRSVKRALEQVMAVGRSELVRLAGNGCEAGEALVARFAFGLATPRERGQAQLHLTQCSQCGALYERLGWWHDKVAALLPVPAIAGTHPSAFERAVDFGADQFGGVKRHVTVVRDHVVESGHQVKQHAATTYYRAVDPTPLAGVRPGPAVATIASCLVIGGGAATYCVQKGVGPVGPAHEEPVARREPPKPRTHEESSRVQQASATPAMTVTTPAPRPPVKHSSGTHTQTAASAPATQTTAAPAPAPQDEYEPVVSAASSRTSASSSAASVIKRQPAPAPSGGAGEFDGP